MPPSAAGTGPSLRPWRAWHWAVHVWSWAAAPSDDRHDLVDAQLSGARKARRPTTGRCESPWYLPCQRAGRRHAPSTPALRRWEAAQRRRAAPPSRRVLTLSSGSRARPCGIALSTRAEPCSIAPGSRAEPCGSIELSTRAEPCGSIAPGTRAKPCGSIAPGTRGAP